MAADARFIAAVELLTSLQNLLYSKQQNLDMITVADIQRRYPLTGLGIPAMRAIEQSQRMIRATNNYELIGLCEFHVGLIYLWAQDSRGASQQFAEARRQWSFVNATAAVCLSLFAEGLAQELALHHETAMALYGKAEQRLPRIRFDQPDEPLRRFTSTLALELRQARESLRMLLQEQWQERGCAVPAASPPPDLQSPTPSGSATLPAQQTIAPVPQYASPLPIGDTYRWFRVARQRAGFLPRLGSGMFVQANTAVAPSAAPMLVVVGTGEEVPAHLRLYPHAHMTPFVYLYLGQWPGGETAVTDQQEAQLTVNLGDGPITLTGALLGRVVAYASLLEAPDGWVEMGD